MRLTALLSLSGLHCAVDCPPGMTRTLDLCVAGGRTDRQHWYVDAEHGKDSNEGGESTPFRTYRRAMAVAQSPQIVHFAAGVYAAEADDFSAEIPEGVTLAGPASGGAATFRGSGSESLRFAGDGTVRNLMFENFEPALSADRGRQLIERVYIRGSIPLRLAGDTRLTCTECSIDHETPIEPGENGIQVLGSAVLVLSSSSLSHAQPAPRHLCTGNPSLGIVVQDSASIEIERTTVAGDFVTPLHFDAQGSATIRNASFGGGCLNTSVISYRGEVANFDIEDSVFEGGVSLHSAGSLRMRRSTFRGPHGLRLAGPALRADLGKPPGETAAEPGGNVFRTVGCGLTLGSHDVIADAHGNSWNPYVQGADLFGEYATGTRFRAPPNDVVNGPNICVSDYGGDLGTWSEVRL